MKRQNVGIDLKTFSLKYAGIGRYTVNLVSELINRNSYSYFGYVTSSTEKHILPVSNIQLVEGLASNIKSTVLRSVFFLPFPVGGKKIDLFHSLDNSTINLLPNSKCKRLSTIHDLIVFKHPEFFTKKHVLIVQNLISQVAKKADHIIVDSVSTKDHLQEVFPFVKDNKISVIHLAVTSMQKRLNKDSVSCLKNKLRLPQRYFFSLATHEPRKNLKSLIEAFRLVKKKPSFDDIGLVLAGGQGWLDSGLNGDPKKLEDEQIFLLGYQDDTALSALFSGAVAFVYPSFYEGFGLPVLEAMTHGCPIITSDLSSLPEVAGDAALYIDPYSIASICDAFTKIMDSEDLRLDLSKKAIANSKEFSWEKTAAQTEAVYSQLLNC